LFFLLNFYPYFSSAKGSDESHFTKKGVPENSTPFFISSFAPFIKISGRFRHFYRVVLMYQDKREKGLGVF
jgi:hypothetical protein